MSLAATQTVRCIWIQPFFKGRIPQSHVNHVAKAAQEFANTTGLREFIRRRQRADDAVHKKLLAATFEAFWKSLPSYDLKSGILQILAIYAEAAPCLISQQNAERLGVLFEDLNEHTMLLFRDIVRILRSTLPNLSQGFLEKARKDLMLIYGQLREPELNDVIPFLRDIYKALKKPEGLVRVMVDVLKRLGSNDPGNQVQRLIALSSLLIYHCDFQPELFNERAVDVAASQLVAKTTVAEKVIATIISFDTEEQPLALQNVALRSMRVICVARPQCFESVRNHFLAALHGADKSKHRIVLLSLVELISKKDPPPERVSIGI